MYRQRNNAGLYIHSLRQRQVAFVKHLVSFISVNATLEDPKTVLVNWEATGSLKFIKKQIPFPPLTNIGAVSRKYGEI